MIYDPVHVRTSVSNKRQVWWGGEGESDPPDPRTLPLDPPLLYLLRNTLNELGKARLTILTQKTRNAKNIKNHIQEYRQFFMTILRRHYKLNCLANKYTQRKVWLIQCSPIWLKFAQQISRDLYQLLASQTAIFFLTSAYISLLQVIFYPHNYIFSNYHHDTKMLRDKRRQKFFHLS